MRFRLLLSVVWVASACGAVSDEEPRTDAEAEPPAPAAGEPCSPPVPAAPNGMRTVRLYFACDAGAPGSLSSVYRLAPDSVAPVEAAVRELLRGPTEAERQLGFRSFFSERTAQSVRSVEMAGDTVIIHLAGISESVADVPGARSFLPPGIMADLTWTVFHQVPEIQALRVTLDGSEAEFWAWIGGEPQTFTREMWEQI